MTPIIVIRNNSYENLSTRDPAYLIYIFTRWQKIDTTLVLDKSVLEKDVIIIRKQVIIYESEGAVLYGAILVFS